jgi:hypothetical protein
MTFDGCDELEDWERLEDLGIAVGDVNQLETPSKVGGYS